MDEDVSDAKTSSSIPESFSRFCEVLISPNLFSFLQHSTVCKEYELSNPHSMGSCSSCLSSCLGWRNSQLEVLYPDLAAGKLHTNLLPCSQHPETSRLLYDDPYRAQYGSHIQNMQRPVYQPDPEPVKREREALDGICHAMSEYGHPPRPLWVEST